MQIRMTMPSDRKRFGGEGRVRGPVLHVVLLKSSLIRPTATFSLRGRRDKTAQLQHWRFGLVLREMQNVRCFVSDTPSPVRGLCQ